MEELRSMAYNPINTKVAPVATPSTSYTAGNAPVMVTEDVRAQMFTQAGIPDFMGVSIMEILELGVGRKFNTVFDVLAGSTAFADHYNINAYSGTATAFDGAAEEIMIGLDRSRDSLVRLVAVDADTGSEFSLQADDQYIGTRNSKIGFYGSLEEGRVVLDNRALCGLIL